MQAADLEAYLLPHADPHASEYLPAHWDLIPWLSGFTGSAATVIVTADFAGVWTDSRYFIQGETQLAGTGFSLMKLKVPHTPEYQDWLLTELPSGSRIGVDPRLISLSQKRRLTRQLDRKALHLIESTELLSPLWPERPDLPQAPVEDHPVAFCGLARADKLAAVREQMAQRQATVHLLNSLDDIAWLLNLRGADVTYNPVALAYALITQDQATLFIDGDKLSADLLAELATDGVQVAAYEEVAAHLAALPLDGRLWIDPRLVSSWLSQQWPAEMALEEGPTPSTTLKAVKNDTEVAHVRQVMIRDGLALVHFFRWLEEALPSGKLTEHSIADKLEAFRQEQNQYVGPSFGTIAGYQGNGAIVHYAAQPETAATLLEQGLLLLDSGGQYRDGTTDITRTITLGDPSAAQRRDFTLVLKGHIGLATAIFPVGTTGVQLDGFARRPLWDHLVNYGHGTGHGVGFFLNVHEGPQRISPSPSASAALLPGMLTSNEPGIYHEGQYGIRIENLMLCIEAGATEAFGSFLGFETVTLCPIDLRLVERTLLTEAELIWLNRYHEKVYEALAPHCEGPALTWLREKTMAI
jgi:Xaa-Pro aminopeptidase